MRTRTKFRGCRRISTAVAAFVLAACDEPLAPRVSPEPEVAPPAPRGGQEVARAVLGSMVAQWNTPGSAVHADAAQVIPHTRLAARAAEAERGNGGHVSVEGLIARGRRAAAAATARAKVAP